MGTKRQWALALLIASCGGGQEYLEYGGERAPVDIPVEAASEVPIGEDVRDPGRIEEELSARLSPRELAIPTVAAGEAATFRVDDTKRGWFARMPEGQQALVTPVYGNGKVFLGAGFGSHTFYALNSRTGRREWTAPAPDGGPTAAIVVEDRVLYNTESCTLFVVDAATGQLRWSRWLGDPLMGQAAAANGLVFSGHIRDNSRSPSGPGRYGLTAMRLENGEVEWSSALSADVMNAPVLHGESIYLTTMDGVVWRFDQRRGRLQWRADVHATSAPSLQGEHVLVTRQRRVQDATGQKTLEQTILLDRSDGDVERELPAVEASFLPNRPDEGGVPAGWAFEGSRPTIYDGRIYQTIGNEVHCRDARTGELLWRRTLPRPPGTAGRPMSSPAIAGSQLVFGTADGVLFGLDVDTGLASFAYDVGEPIAAQPTIAHGWVYAATTAGGVVGIEVGDPTLDGWHMWGGNAAHNGPTPIASRGPIPREVARPSEGTLGLEQGDRVIGFPLTGTEVDARVSGMVARVTVEQRFQSPFDQPVEAVYLFPLPDDAAVDAMELRTGDRVIRAHIARREQARTEYTEARDSGRLASLLEQERPNLFRQSVANILPGETVRVVIRYTQLLPYEEGSYRFRFPMVAVPRYTPGAGSPEAAAGSAHQAVLGPGQPRRDRVHLSLHVDAGAPLGAIDSPTHALAVTRGGTREAEVALREEAVPNRDLEVRMAVAGGAPVISVASTAAGQGAPGYVAVAVHPRLDVPDRETTPRELVFLVDTSSSMRGAPIALARAAVIRALGGLRPSDTFRVVRFSDGAQELADGPLPATPDNVERATAHVRDLRAFGATQMVRGLRAALDPPIAEGRTRLVLLLTDGFIGNETEIFREVDRRLGDARVFALGVGSAVNRYLLTRLTEIGRGDLQVVTPSERAEDAADRWASRIARPYLTDVQVAFEGVEVSDLYPRRIPDVFADRPVVVQGKLGGGGAGAVVVRGRLAGRPYEQRVPFRAGDGPARPELGSLWARARVRDLMTEMALREDPALVEEVTELGLTHGLLTQYTSFVAVDAEARAPATGAPPARVEQPGSLPEDRTAADGRELEANRGEEAIEHWVAETEQMAERTREVQMRSVQMEMQTATVGGYAGPGDYADEDGTPDVEEEYEGDDDGEPAYAINMPGAESRGGGCAHCAASPGTPGDLLPWLAVLGWLLARRRRSRYSRSKIGKAAMSSPNDA